MFTEVRKGILGINTAYNPEQKKWKQAHSQGAFVITQFMLQNQKSKVIDIEMLKNGTFYININEENMNKEGHELIAKMLHTLQVYKSTGAVDRAREFYMHYSTVKPEDLEIRKSIIKKKQAPGLRIFSNMIKAKKAHEPELVTYPETF